MVQTDVMYKTQNNLSIQGTVRSRDLDNNRFGKNTNKTINWAPFFPLAVSQAQIKQLSGQSPITRDDTRFTVEMWIFDLDLHLQHEWINLEYTLYTVKLKCLWLSENSNMIEILVLGD